VTVHDVPVNTLNGEPGSLGDLAGALLLVVNVASKCGLTPQYAGLERLHERYAGRHPVYAELTAVPDAGGEAGDVLWNFEKFLVGPDGAVLARFRPQVTPEDPELVAAIEANLPG
jgi:glutathione peroxidase